MSYRKPSQMQNNLFTNTHVKHADDMM